MPALFVEQRAALHAAILADLLRVDGGVPSNADGKNVASVAFAKGMCERMGTAVAGVRPPGQFSGSNFEDKIGTFLRACFPSLSHLRPGTWTIERVRSRDGLAIAKFVQYQHLRALAALMEQNPQLAATLGDYQITPDIIICRSPEEDLAINRTAPLIDGTCSTRADLRKSYNSEPLLHASVSCKWSLRSDRAQNVRAEASNLIRNRKGHLPHLVAVTAEPLPSRLASLALGTGDVDCVYHLALPELEAAINATGYADAQDMMRNLIAGRRIKDISDLPLDLAV